MSGFAAFPLVSTTQAECLSVATLVMKPVELFYQLGGQLDAGRIDGEAAGIDAALAGYHVQVAAGGLGEEDGAPFVLQFFEAAETAMGAEGFPFVSADF